MESRFLEPSVSRTSRYFEPNLVSLGFASLRLYNFTHDFSNPRFLETPDNSNQFWLPWDKLTLDTSNQRKFPKYLVRMSIKFTSLFKQLGYLDNLRKSTRNISQIIHRDNKLLPWLIHLNWVILHDNTCVLLCSAFAFLSTISGFVNKGH